MLRGLTTARREVARLLNGVGTYIRRRVYDSRRWQGGKLFYFASSSTTEGGQANPDFFLQKSFHSFGDGSSREAGHYVRVTDEGVTADARGRPWGPWGGTCPTPGQNNGDFIPWHALSAYSRDTAPRFWR